METNNLLNFELECKYCSEIIDIEKGLKPCLCSDYVHPKCFRKWIMIRPIARNEDANDVLSRCEICNSKYNISITSLIEKRLNKTLWDKIKDTFIKKLCFVIIVIFLFLAFMYILVVISSVIYDQKYK